MGRTPSPERIAKLKRLSILDAEETEKLVAEAVRITERSKTPAELPGDNRRFSEIITSMMSEENQTILLKALVEKTRN